MVCGNVDFGLSGGEEAGNATKIRAVYGKFKLLREIKIVRFKRGKGDLILSYIIYKNQFPLLQRKENKKCNIASVHPVLFLVCF